MTSYSYSNLFSVGNCVCFYSGPWSSLKRNKICFIAKLQNFDIFFLSLLLDFTNFYLL